MSIHTDRLAGRLERTVARHDDVFGLGLSKALDTKLPWFKVTNAAGMGTADAYDDEPGEPSDTAQVYIYDEIGGSMGASAKKLTQQIDAIATPYITVRLNSPGGSVTDAVAIHSALMQHPATVRCVVDGWAASAASVIMMAADPYDPVTDKGGVVAMPGSQTMLHDASMMNDGNAADHTHAATFLERQSDNLAGMYARRAGGTPAEWRQRMLDETWAFADEAVALNLADKVGTAGTTPVPAEMAEPMARTFDLARYAYRGRQGPPSRTVTLTSRATGGATTRSRDAGIPRDDAAVNEPLDLAGAAAARGEATERRAHALAQEGRSVPVLRTSDRFRASMRTARTELPTDVGAARIQGFASKLQVVNTVTRGNADLVHLSGYASMYGEKNRYEMWDVHGPYYEWLAARAGSQSLATKPNVAFLVNHMGLTMARTWNNTLELADDDDALADDAYVNPERTDVADLVTSIRDGDVEEQSFAFMIDEGHWSEDFSRFCIARYDINRGDVSAVTFGANPYTSISARGQQILSDIDRLPPGLARAAYARLGRRTDVAIARAASMPTAKAGDAGNMTLSYSRWDREEEPVAARPNVSISTGDDLPLARGRRITQIEALMGDD